MSNAPVIFGPNSRATNLQNGFLNSDGSTVKNDGLINYIQNPGFENGTTNGWTLSRVTLTNNFPSAPSGSISAGVTFVPYQTTVLSGNYSGAFTSTTSFVAGDSLVSSTMTIDPKYQSQVISFSFSYKVDAGASLGVFAGNNTNTFGIAIYDVTNGVFVQPSSGLWSIDGYAGTAAGQFQTASNGSQYQFAIFANTGVTGAFRFLVDDFFWGASVPAGNDGRVVSFAGSYTGASLNLTADVTNVTFTTLGDRTNSWNGSVYTVPIAGDYVVTGGLQLAGTGVNGKVFVNGSFYNNGFFSSATNSYSAGTVYIYNAKAGDQISLRSSGTTTSSTGQLSIYRIAGPTSGDEGRVVAAIVSGTSTSFTTASPTITPTTIVKDTSGGWSGNFYTVPVSGYYNISGYAEVVGSYTAGNAAGLSYVVNGGGNVHLGWTRVTITAATTYFLAGSALVYLNAGDKVNFTGFSDVTATASLLNLNIFRISGPNAVSAQATVAVRYLNTAGTSLPAATVTSVPFAVKDYDTNSLYNGTTATIQSAGKYRITCGIITAATTLATTGTVSTQVYKNGSFNTIIGGASGNGAAVTRAVNGTTTLNLVAGDTIDIRVYTDAATTLLTTSGYNYFEIQKVGN